MDNIEAVFREAGAVLDGHFLLASGRHSPVYWEKFQVIQFPEHTVPLCEMIADRFRDYGVDVVAGPTTAGIILAFEVARQMGKRAIYAERAEGGGRTFGRGLTLAPGERVLVVDDVLTVGGSVKDVITAVKALGGIVVGVGVLVDRSQNTLDLGVPLFGCHRAVAVSYAPAECPQCAAGMPLTTRGTSHK
jgi:orotate phosphoribosyltransferase